MKKSKIEDKYNTINHSKQTYLQKKPTNSIDKLNIDLNVDNYTINDMKTFLRLPNKTEYNYYQLYEKVQEKISSDLADKYEYGGEVKGKKRKKSKGNVCRGGGAALRGTSFSGTK